MVAVWWVSAARCSRRCSRATNIVGGRGLIWCAMFLSMPPSLSCVEMRRRRIGSGRAYVVLLTELLGERGAHDGAADAGRGREVRLARLSSGRRQSWGGRGQYEAAWQQWSQRIQVLILVILSVFGRVRIVCRKFKSRWSSQKAESERARPQILARLWATRDFLGKSDSCWAWLGCRRSLLPQARALYQTVGFALRRLECSMRHVFVN